VQPVREGGPWTLGLTTTRLRNTHKEYKSYVKGEHFKEKKTYNPSGRETLRLAKPSPRAHLGEG
jgi:hypothetical protein